jgi:hypothetical protein
MKGYLVKSHCDVAALRCQLLEAERERERLAGCLEAAALNECQLREKLRAMGEKHREMVCKYRRCVVACLLCF